MSFEKQRLGKLSIRSFLLWYSSFFRSLQMMVQMKFVLVEFRERQNLLALLYLVVLLFRLSHRSVVRICGELHWTLINC